MPRSRESAARAAAVTGVLASVHALMMPFLIGALRPNYQHVRDYISELGETGSPFSHWVNWGGFLPIGLLVLAFVYMASARLPIDRTSSWLLSCVGWSYLVAWVFPCDPGCPERGSVSQLIHNLAGLVFYPAIAVGLLRSATSFGRDASWKRLAVFTRVCGWLVALGFGLMLVRDLEPWRGLSQRIAETAIFAWVAAVSIVLWKSSKT